MTEEERFELQKEFCGEILKEMTEKERISFAYNVLMDSYSQYDEELFLKEVQEYFPKLLTIDVEKEEGCD